MKESTIVVIGGANIEYIITSDQPIEYGAKNSVEIEELYGGSGVNYTLRLLNADKRVYPILFIGDDHAGRQIQREVAYAASKLDEKIHRFITQKTFFVPEVATPRSTIIIEGSRRTILTHDKNHCNCFRSYVEKRIQNCQEASALIIGHIHNDKPALNRHAEELCTLFAIRYYQDKNTLIYANFGASQLAHGFGFWKTYLPLIDILQLNIFELKNFFQKENEYPTLEKVVSTIHQLGISVIITLDKFGAIGILKDHNDTIFMARPVELGDRFVDSTGAGDAFCAGMVSLLEGTKEITPQQFKEAMSMARSWAVYACMSYGGANNCPDAPTIAAFHEEIARENEVLLYQGERIKDIFALIDITMELHES
jgi:sugar/nucleoside kinase (ribokinase family)